MENSVDIVDEESFSQINVMKIQIAVDQTPKCNHEISGEGVDYT